MSGDNEPHPPAKTPAGAAPGRGRPTIAAVLRGTASDRYALAATLFALLAERDQRSFSTDSGLLPNSGFFPELRQIQARKLLPEPIDPGIFSPIAPNSSLVTPPVFPVGSCRRKRYATSPQ